MKKVLFLAISAGMLHAQTPSEAEIRAILVDRIDTARQGVGIVVGIIDANGRDT